MIALAAALFLVAAPLEAMAQSTQASAAIDVTLKNGRTAKPQTFRVKLGDEVTLRVASDRRIALHLHGYDIESTAEPDKPAVFSFTAKATGRFPMEEHVPDTGKKSHSHAPAVLYLEVLPN
jgi:hypothetical protein